MKTLKIFRFLFITLSILFAVCTQSNTDILAKFVFAHNSKNIEGELSCFSKDFIYCVDSDTIQSKDKYKKLRGWDYELNSIIAIKNVTAHHDTLLFKLKEINDWGNLIGMDTTYVDNGRIIIENGLIREFAINSDENAIKLYRKITDPFGEWIEKSRKDQLNEIVSKGTISKETAPLWTKLWLDWQNNRQNIAH